jgi:hypothetical protein
VAELQTLLLPLFVERAAGIEQRVDAAGAGAGVTKDVKIHLFLKDARERGVDGMGCRLSFDAGMEEIWGS